MDRDELIQFYNATSTLVDKTGEIETYEYWLEKQLMNRIEELQDGENELHIFIVEHNNKSYTWSKNNWVVKEYYKSYEKAKSQVDYLIAGNIYTKTDLRIVEQIAY